MEVLHGWHGEQWRVVVDLWGFRWVHYYDDLEDAIRDADGRKHAEVVQVDRFVEEMEPILTTVAIVADGEWILLEEDVTMAKVEKARKRDPIADLLGEDDKKNSKGKKTMKKGKVVKKTAAKASGYTDDQKIKVVKSYSPREGTNTAKAWGCVAKAKTIGELKKLRKKAGFDADVGGLLGGWVRDGYVRVS